MAIAAIWTFSFVLAVVDIAVNISLFSNIANDNPTYRQTMKAKDDYFSAVALDVGSNLSKAITNSINSDTQHFVVVSSFKIGQPHFVSGYQNFGNGQMTTTDMSEDEKERSLHIQDKMALAQRVRVLKGFVKAEATDRSERRSQGLKMFYFIF